MQLGYELALSHDDSPTRVRHKQPGSDSDHTLPTQLLYDFNARLWMVDPKDSTVTKANKDCWAAKSDSECN